MYYETMEKVLAKTDKTDRRDQRRQRPTCRCPAGAEGGQVSAMWDAVRRNPILWAGVTLIVLALLASVMVIVPETKQALILRFNAPSRIANGYDPKEEFGRTGAGWSCASPSSSR